MNMMSVETGPAWHQSVVSMAVAVMIVFASLGAPMAKAKTPVPDDKPVVVSSADVPILAWSPALDHTISEAELIARLSSAKFVVLGEVHDNPLHHALRARIVRLIMAARKQQQEPQMPAAVFEHVATDGQQKLDRVYGELGGGNADETAANIFFDQTNWDSTGWPKRATFRPLVTEILQHKMPLYAGDIPRQLLKNVVRKPDDMALVPQAKRDRLGLEQPLDAKVQDGLKREISQAHCGVMPPEMIAPMAFGQRLRDATLADVMINAVRDHNSAILFTGNGHAERDRGVPWYLAYRGARSVVSVLFKETSGLSPVTANEIVPAGKSDYVIWTAERNRPDMCESLRKKYGKTKK